MLSTRTHALWSVSFVPALAAFALSLPLAGCGSDGGSPPTIEHTAHENYDTYRSKLTVDPSARAALDAPQLTTTPHGALEQSLVSLAPSAPPDRPVICGGNQDYGGRICCNSTHCCFNLGGTITCGD